MRLKTLITTISTTGLLLAGISFAPASQAAASSCASITKAAVVGDGFTGAIDPTITSYNYANPSANQANALGTTIDFGIKALVVGCISPADIAKLSVTAQGAKKPAMTATQYLAYVVKQSAGAMKKSAVGGFSDYLDFGNGKEDGVGSTSKAGSLRLDSWVAGKYIFLTFYAPAGAPSPALLKFMKSTKSF